MALVCLGAYGLRKLGWESDFGRPWRVDTEASVAGIRSVPDHFSHRFRSLDEYKDFVRGTICGLTLRIHENGTQLVWRKDDDFDYWLNTKGNWFFPIATIGHGFDRVSSRTARLKFQLEWDEDMATREFLVLRR